MAYCQLKSNFLHAGASLSFGLLGSCAALPLRFGADPSISEQVNLIIPFLILGTLPCLQNPKQLLRLPRLWRAQ